MKERKAKKVTAGYVERAALHYLGRFASSEANLRAVLERKIRRRNQANNLEAAEAAETIGISEEQSNWIDDVIQKCRKYGYVNDVHYAEERSKQLLRKGKPIRMIRQDLIYKGVPADITDDTLRGLASGNLLVSHSDNPDQGTYDADLYAAAAFVKRRRFGPYRRDMPKEAEQAKVQKELASMARSGFSFDLSRKVLEMSVDDILSVLN